MDFWDQGSTAQRLIKSFGQFRKLDWNKESVGNFKPSEIQVLFCIKKKEKDDNITVSDISKLLNVTSPTVTQIVNGLEDKGVVERQINKQDRRSIKVSLTNEGEQVTEQAAQKYASSIDGLIEYLGENQTEQLIQLMDQVFTYYKEVNKRK